MPTTRLYEIDLYRFIAAVLVVIFHYTFVGHMLHMTPAIDVGAVDTMTRYFYLGINFFFVISGFVILMSVRDKQPKRFLWSRFTRLYPAYWFGVIATTLVILLAQQEFFSVSWTQFFANLTMWQSGFGIGHIDPPYWTLWIEWQFYLLILALSALGALRHIQHLIGLSLIVCLGVLLTDQHIYFTVWTNAFPHWWGYFAIGCLLFLLYRDGMNAYRALLSALALAFVVEQNLVFANLMESWYGVDFSAIAIVCINLAFLLLFCGTIWWQQHPLRKAGFIVLGGISYPLYIIHQNIGFIVLNAYGDAVPHLVLISGLTLIMIAVAYGVYRFWERPLQKLIAHK